MLRLRGNHLLIYSKKTATTANQCPFQRPFTAADFRPSTNSPVLEVKVAKVPRRPHYSSSRGAAAPPPCLCQRRRNFPPLRSSCSRCKTCGRSVDKAVHLVEPHQVESCAGSIAVLRATRSTSARVYCVTGEACEHMVRVKAEAASHGGQAFSAAITHTRTLRLTQQPLNQVLLRPLLPPPLLLRPLSGLPTQCPAHTATKTRSRSFASLQCWRPASCRPRMNKDSALQ